MRVNSLQRRRSAAMRIEDAGPISCYMLTNNFTRAVEKEKRILITKIPFRAANTCIYPAYKLQHTHTRALFAARDRYEPKAGVCSLICLMSRYYNDFASDLRLFIYSPAVLADRSLITGGLLSLY